MAQPGYTVVQVDIAEFNRMRFNHYTKSNITDASSSDQNLEEQAVSNYDASRIRVQEEAAAESAAANAAAAEITAHRSSNASYNGGRRGHSRTSNTTAVSSSDIVTKSSRDRQTKKVTTSAEDDSDSEDENTSAEDDSDSEDENETFGNLRGRRVSNSAGSRRRSRNDGQVTYHFRGLDFLDNESDDDADGGMEPAVPEEESMAGAAAAVAGEGGMEPKVTGESNYDEDAILTPKMTKKKKYTSKNIGEVGYTFRKQFEDGWYWGEVIKIRPGAAHGKDRRIHYEDGDSEDLSIVELETLASLDPKFDMAVAGEGGLEPAAVQVTALADQQVAGADSTISALDDDDSSKPRTSKRLRKRKRKRKVSE